jgi:hypothetical protein
MLAEMIPPRYESLGDTFMMFLLVMLAPDATYWAVILWFYFIVLRVFLDG